MYQVSWTTSGNTRSESGVLVTLKETTEFTGTKLPSGIVNEAVAFSCTEFDTAFTTITTTSITRRSVEHRTRALTALG